MNPTPEQVKKAEEITKKHSYCDVRFANCKCCTELANVIALALTLTAREARIEALRWAIDHLWKESDKDMLMVIDTDQIDAEIKRLTEGV
jgi:hypothetical protein